jgi:hypothetical protein
MANAVTVVRDTFAQARQRQDRAVIVLLQADMFDPTYTPNFATDISAFKPLVQALVDEASAFDGPVYLVNGDSHIYNSDCSLASGSKWLTTYGVTGTANNPGTHHRRRVGQQQGLAARHHQSAGASSVPSWERVPYVL